jgi:anti-sigma B factor antagonist
MAELATVLSEDLDETTVVTVRGEIDVSNGDDVHAAILDAVSLRTRCLLLDLTDVDYFDSVGVRVAFDLEKRLSRQSISFGIVRPATSYVRKVLEMCGAEQLLAMYDDRDAALNIS